MKKNVCRTTKCTVKYSCAPTQIDGVDCQNARAQGRGGVWGECLSSLPSCAFPPKQNPAHAALYTM